MQAVAGSAAAVVAIVALAGFAATRLGDDKKNPPAAQPSASAPPGGCAYTKQPAGQGRPLPRKVDSPSTKEVVKTGTVQVVVKTNQGELTLSLDRAKAPCTVNSFVSLAQQKYFDNTLCHRVTTSGFYVLQCGDPSGTGGGGPGYVFPDEGLPADQSAQVPYLAATVAMANAGPGTNGSQFFIVYKDTQFPPAYTVFGTVTKGLDVVTKIAQNGSTPAGDGKPNKPVKIESVAITV